MFGGGPQIDFLALWMGANFTDTANPGCMFPPLVRGAAEPRFQLAAEGLVEADGAEANCCGS